MKPNVKYLAICLAAALLGAAAMAQTTTATATTKAPAAAALPPAPTVTGPSKIGIIDIRDAILSTAEGKKLMVSLQARFAPRETVLKNAQAAITALQNQLKNGGNTMSDEAKQNLNSQIQSKERDFQQEYQNDQTDFQSAQTDVLNTVGNKMMPIIEKYAKEHGYTAIVDVSFSWPQQPVLYFNPGTVITGDIVRLYDQAAFDPAKPGQNQKS
ncbi:MAG: OmpH family outer membrane protein [Terriglobales bacterium]